MVLLSDPKQSLYPLEGNTKGKYKGEIQRGNTKGICIQINSSKQKQAGRNDLPETQY